MPSMLQSVGLQRIGHDLVTEQQYMYIWLLSLFLVVQADKNLPANAGDVGLIPGLGRFYLHRANKLVHHNS